jgi:hypothetical protein
VVDLEELVGAEWAGWYRLTPAQRWLESEKLWQTYLALGGSLDPEPDTQSPFYDPQAPRPRPAQVPERERDRVYWLPLKSEIEQLRHQQRKLPKYHDLLVGVINSRQVLNFSYEGYARVVEPQTYGMSYTGRYVLRGRQTGGESSSGQSKIAKLFDVAKISKLQKSGQHFKQALPSHNPQDSAMKVIFATLPKPSK